MQAPDRGTAQNGACPALPVVLTLEPAAHGQASHQPLVSFTIPLHQPAAPLTWLELLGQR